MRQNEVERLLAAMRQAQKRWYAADDAAAHHNAPEFCDILHAARIDASRQYKDACRAYDAACKWASEQVT